MKERLLVRVFSLDFSERIAQHRYYASVNLHGHFLLDQRDRLGAGNYYRLNKIDLARIANASQTVLCYAKCNTVSDF